MPAQTIADVLAELDDVIAWARADRLRVGYFAVLYREVTKRVADGIVQGRFEDGARMERLDVIFANRYLDAVACYRQNGSPTRCWSAAFRLADAWRPIVLQHLLVGMHAHINLDLGIAAAETAPGGELRGLRKDFFEITTLLGELLEDMQDRISTISPWLGLLDRAGARTDEQIFFFGLSTARDFAWRCAEQLARSPRAVHAAQIELTDQAVALGADVLGKPRYLLPPLLLAIRLREPNDPAVVIEALEG